MKLWLCDPRPSSLPRRLPLHTSLSCYPPPQGSAGGTPLTWLSPSTFLIQAIDASLTLPGHLHEEARGSPKGSPWCPPILQPL